MSVTTPRPRGTAARRRSTTWASATVTALVASTVALTASPASAVAEPAPVLKWKVSQFFDEHLSTHTLGGDTTEDGSGVVTFPAGATTLSAGTLRTAYTGSVSGAFFAGPTEYYHVKIEDPTVEVGPDGSGRVTAEVSASNIDAGPGKPAASTTPARVEVAHFAADNAAWSNASNSRRTLTATPDWAGVLAAGSTRATDLGIPSGQPVDGKSFSATFLDQVTPAVRALFYASGASSDVKKSPAVLVAEAAPVVTAAITSQSAQDGVVVDVDGVGFTPGSNPGDDGVYAGIAPVGGLPDVSSQAGMASFAGSAWVSASQIVNGRFSTTVTADAAKLDTSKTYALYTWRAHGHSTTTQDTETPLAIDFAQLRPAPSLTITGPTRTGYGTTPAYVVKLSAGTGTVRLTGAGTARVATVSGGSATFALPRTLAAGTRTLTFAYSGDSTQAATSVARRVVVTKGGTVLRHVLARRATKKQAGILTVSVAPSRAGSATPVGRVRVLLAKGSQRRVVTSGLLRAGRVSVVLPKVAKGTWSTRLTYLGSANYLGSSSARQLVVAKK